MIALLFEEAVPPQALVLIDPMLASSKTEVAQLVAEEVLTEEEVAMVATTEV